MSNRIREIQIRFKVSEHEHRLIRKRMEQFGTDNQAAYLRKMAIDAETVCLYVPELKEIVRHLQFASDHLNQMAKRSHVDCEVHATDIEGLRGNFDTIWKGLRQVLFKLSCSP